MAGLKAQSSAMHRIAAGIEGLDVDAAGLIARYGLDRVAHPLTDMINEGLRRVACKRGGQVTPDAVLEDYIRRMFRRMPDESRDIVMSHVKWGRHPPIPDLKEQEEFLLGLFTLRTAAVLELAGTYPVDG